MILNEQLAECLTLHANFSDIKAHALKSFYTFYTLDLFFRMNYKAHSISYLRSSCLLLVNISF